MDSPMGRPRIHPEGKPSARAAASLARLRAGGGRQVRVGLNADDAKALDRVRVALDADNDADAVRRAIRAADANNKDPHG
mgnify:CR=1 FL=1